jgi:arylsulfatase A-like enzyme
MSIRLSLILLLFGTLVRAERPNVILVLTDDQGIGDVGVHGNRQIRTPAIDEFARDGIQLTRFYVEPVCAPTRAAIMTGRYHYRTGVIHTSRGGAKMAAAEKTVAEYLQEVGYQTGIFGKWHLGDNYPMRPEDQGFIETLVHKSGGIGQTPDRPNGYFEPLLWHNGRQIRAQGYCTDIFFDAAIEFIEANASKSFFVYLPLNAPHTPLEIADRYVANYRAMGLNDTTAKVYGMVENIDDNFGRLLKRLESLGLRENTVVIFMTDNGAQHQRYNAGFRGRKSHVYEGGIRVPFFLQWPAEYARPLKLDTVAAHIDLLPTIIDFTAYQGLMPQTLDGRSLRQMLHQRTSKWPDRRIAFQVHRGLRPQPFQNSALVSQRYKLLGHPGTFGKEDLDLSQPKLELYDLISDPAEKQNIALEKPDIVRQLTADYRRWFASVQASRNFTPGRIHIGNSAENPTRLCRYQDSTFVNGKPTNWSVKIERGGRYRISINRGDSQDGGRLHVRFNDRSQSRPLLPGSNSATFSLPTGEGELEIWVEEDGKGRIVTTDNSTLGNVDLRLLSAGN